MSLVRVATYGGYQPADPFFQTTPDAVDRAVAAFFIYLGVSSAEFVEVRPALGAELGMCQRNVTEHIKRNGGTLVHVWAIWANHLFLMGEFHAIWRSPAVELVDVTPTAEGESRVLCAVAEDYGEDFDFARRPANRAMRTVDPVDPVAVSRAIEAMSPACRSYEEGRAARRGLDLASHVAANLPLSELAATVEALIKCCELRDRLVVPTRSGVYLFDVASARIGPVAGIAYSKSSVNAYTETGDPLLAFTVLQPNLESLTGSAGIQVRAPFSIGPMFFSPYVNVTAEHEFKGGNRTLLSVETQAPVLPIVSSMPGPGQITYGKIAGGIAAQISQQIGVAINAAGTFARDGGNDFAVSGRFKLEFAAR